MSGGTESVANGVCSMKTVITTVRLRIRESFQMNNDKQYLFTANGSYFGKTLIAATFLFPINSLGSDPFQKLPKYQTRLLAHLQTDSF
jgi:hypothetical protein